jgi:hypothetical protein
LFIRIMAMFGALQKLRQRHMTIATVASRAGTQALVLQRSLAVPPSNACSRRSLELRAAAAVLVRRLRD